MIENGRINKVDKPIVAEVESFSRGIRGIYTASDKGLPMITHQSIEVLPAVGLAGDRYATTIARGVFSGSRIPDEYRQVSIISSHAIVQANEFLANQEIDPFSWFDLRRNIVVDIDPEDLNALVDQEFSLGSVLMEGVELCTPCSRPPKLIEREKKEHTAFISAFERRGGIRARVIGSGVISIGDTIQY